MSTSATVMVAPQPSSLVKRMAAKFGVEPGRMLDSLKATAFHTSREITNEQMMSLLIVAEQYNLNPWTREIYAFPDEKKGGIVPIVSVDGWTRILNDRPELTGIEFEYGPDSELAKHKGAPAWIDCVIHRHDRVKPIRIRERLVECYRETGPWNSHPGRMLRHKALMQAARVAFGFAGIFDADEGERIVQGEVVSSSTPSAVDAINADVKKATAAAAPATVEGELLGPTYGEVRQYIDLAADASDVDTAESMVDGLPEQFRAELHELAKAKRASLAA